MTPTLAKYIGDNFTVVNQVGGLASSFDATVWRGNAGTPYDGQIYVSMRGTQEGPDFAADADLASSGLAHQQLADMVNWWLRETTPTLTDADTPQYATQITVAASGDFALAAPALGTGNLVGIGTIKSVNGHSLGGYLASAFVRLFGNKWSVQGLDTFTGMGNHSMYRLTDLLAVGAALEKLDSTFTMDKLNALSKVGSNDPKGSLEGVLDGLRRALAGPNVEHLPISDAPDSDSSRMTFQATLAALQNNPIFKDLTGKLHIEPTGSSLASLARSDFGALIALQDLSPLYISGTDATAQAQLAEIWQAGRTNDYAAWQSDKSSGTPVNFTDNWITDRAALLQAIVLRNQKDETSNTLATDSAPADRNLQFQWYGADPLPGEINPRLTTLTETKPYYADRPVQKIAFGDDGANALIGTNSTLGDHLYGGAGDDIVLAGDGNDMVAGYEGDDYIDGGAGGDVLATKSIAYCVYIMRARCLFDAKTRAANNTTWRIAA